MCPNIKILHLGLWWEIHKFAQTTRHSGFPYIRYTMERAQQSILLSSELIPTASLFQELCIRLLPLIVIGSEACDFEMITGRCIPLDTPPDTLPVAVSRLLGSCLQMSVESIQEYWLMSRRHVWSAGCNAKPHSPEGDRLLMEHGHHFHVGM